MLEEVKLFREFEEHFGFKAYNEITYIFARLNSKIEQLEQSRDLWRNKYQKLNTELLNAKSKHRTKEVKHEKGKRNNHN